MPKKKILKKRIRSIDDIPITKFKTMEGLTPYSASAKLRDKNHISDALWLCLVANDAEAFKDILRAHLELINKDDLAKKTGISRRTLFRMLSPEGNPTLDNLGKIVHAVCA